MTESGSQTTPRVRVFLEVSCVRHSRREIEAMIGAAGDEAWSRGDVFVGSSGKLRLRRYTCWNINAESDDLYEGDGVVAKIIERAEPLADGFRRLPSDVTVALCIWLDWWPGDPSPGLHFDAQTVEFLNRIGAELDIDTSIYCPE